MTTFMPPPLYVARYETRHFEFEGVGLTEAEARVCLANTLAAHVDEHGGPSAFMERFPPEGWRDDVHVRRYGSGRGYRDGEEIGWPE